MASLQPRVDHTSQQELAIWQPAWPTVEIGVSKRLIGLVDSMDRGPVEGSASKPAHTVQADDFSHSCDEVSGDDDD
jgi:hypothetical protein